MYIYIICTREKGTHLLHIIYIYTRSSPRYVYIYIICTREKGIHLLPDCPLQGGDDDLAHDLYVLLASAIPNVAETEPYALLLQTDRICRQQSRGSSQPIVGD